MSFSTPVLLCNFRVTGLLDELSLISAQLQNLQPDELMIATRGNVNERPSMSENRLEWGGQVRNITLDSGIGHDQFMSLAVDWAFRYCNQLIVLETGWHIDQRFFDYCSTLLDRYQDDEAVMMISGNNFLEGYGNWNSYYFSKYANPIGWATWRRAWRNAHDPQMQDWPTLPDYEWLNALCEEREERRFWIDHFNDQFQRRSDNWLIPWQYSIWRASGLCILPQQNLVQVKESTGEESSGPPAKKKAGWAGDDQFQQWNGPKKIAANKTLDKFVWNEAFVQRTVTGRAA